MEDLVAQIYSQYPWAGEETALRIAELSRSHNIKSSAIATALAQVLNPADSKKIQKHIADTLQDVKTSEQKSKEKVNEVKENIRQGSNILGKPTGIEAIAEISYAGSQALHRLSQGAADMIPGGGKADVFGGLLTGVTGATMGMAAIGTVFAKLMAEQDKQLRMMIDYGLVVGDNELFTELRGRAAGLGMSLGDLAKVTETTSVVLSRTTNNMFDGQMKFADFVAKSYSDNPTKRFGYSIQEYTHMLAAEADMLFQTNQMNDFNAITQKRILKSFETVNQLSLFLADNIGLQRSEAMRLRMEANQNEEFSHALFQNAQYITEQFGVEAATNIKESNEVMNMMLTTVFGEEFAKETEQIMANALSDISFDTSVVNNISGDTLSMLQTMGGNSAALYVDFLEDMIQGKVTGSDAILRIQELAKEIKAANARLSVDETGMAATRLRANIAAAPESFLTFTEDDLERLKEESVSASDVAGTSIDQLSNISIAFKEATNALTPGFETTEQLFDIVTTAGEKFGDTWVKLFGIENPRTIAQREKFNKEQAGYGFSNDAKTIFYNTSGGQGSSTANTVSAAESLAQVEVQLAQAQAQLKKHQDYINKSNTYIEEIKNDHAEIESINQEKVDQLQEQLDQDIQALNQIQQVDYDQQIDDLRNEMRQLIEDGKSQEARQLRTEELRLRRERSQQERKTQKAEDRVSDSREDLQRAKENQQRDIDRNAMILAEEQEANLELIEKTAIKLQKSQQAVQTLTKQRDEYTAIIDAYRTNTANIQDSNAPSITGPGAGMETLLNFIGKGEGSYESSNRGTIKGQGIVGSTHNTMRNGKTLTNMTFKEIFEKQAINDPTNTDRLFAVGKYQIIPSTMQEIFKHSGLSLDDKFTAENQDKLGKLLIQGNNGYFKRPKLAAYLRGEDISIEDAMLEFAQEWASMPNPYTGASYYGNGNRASHSVQEVATALRAARQENTTPTDSSPVTVTEAEIRRDQINERLDELNTQNDTLINNSDENINNKMLEISRLETELSIILEKIKEHQNVENARESING